MLNYNMAIEVWCEKAWGETPKKISEWASNDETVQVFLRLSASVLIADFELKKDGTLTIRQHLHIPLETWNPGSIQGIRTPEGKTRFSHRRQTIYLSSELRAPEWGAALLEDWLLGMRSDVNRPKDRAQRLAEINRMKTSVERNLETAAVEHVSKEISELDTRIDRIGNNLAE
ncbi:hypothetical protein N9N91_00730 [Candidatus Poseidonia alphae]|uniref:hypothetical protein n=1 Tax=Candidatus Poseidonia alphae TaxID=1915863 RepID=UPI00230A1D40|nr:hypothetical protein [Candidatus Poseidonia alphae]MDA8529859.1 hypothetical protein [Candidatus Poseidonia alphae]MDA8638648.1 hypothetical protein [Candidatus Poseidonia alphae]MDA9168064.1 hypothetical protein [Candidatus Poseidonia alphae]